MKIRILSDNIGPKEFLTEWGFSVYIEYGDKKYLLDSGASEKYIINGYLMGVPLKQINYAILSHAHYDHSSGFDAFFNINKIAKLYISSAVQPNCYFKYGFIKKYIGIPKDLLQNHRSRIEYVGDTIQIQPGVYIMRHRHTSTYFAARKEHMALKFRIGYRADNFSHEQNLIFKTKQGLVILNSCSHIGVDKILQEVSETFPNEHIYMYIGGFHLAFSSKNQVLKIANGIKKQQVDKLYTGHCTGERAFKEMKEVLGEKLQETMVGLEIEVEEGEHESNEAK